MQQFCVTDSPAFEHHQNYSSWSSGRVLGLKLRLRALQGLVVGTTRSSSKFLLTNWKKLRFLKN